jgi:NAD(P)-dependent dehydrogenase (short-subunit alcohol dehydrogenase family)
VNYRGTAAVTEALAPLLVPRRGRVVNVSSS